MDYNTHPQKTQGWYATQTAVMAEIRIRGELLPIIYSQLSQ